VARVLIVGDSQRALGLASDLLADGHAVRYVIEAPSRRAEIEGLGIECFMGTPMRLATMRGALEHVTIACWLLGDVGEEALHGSRLERFVCDAIDSTLRGFVYEAGGTVVTAEMLAEGRRIVSETAARNLIPVEILTADPLEIDRWRIEAGTAVRSLLGG
jgi:hypothetical protein